MKSALTPIFALLFLTLISSRPAQAKIGETDQSVLFWVDRQDEAKVFYSQLKLEATPSSDADGKECLVKKYQDPTDAFSILCASCKDGHFSCGFEIKKISPNDQIQIEHDAKVTNAMIYVPEVVKSLYSILDVVPMDHGGYWIKHINTEDFTFGFSCIQGQKSSDMDRCQLIIQK